MKKIVYMGTPQYAKEILQVLLDNKSVEVVLVLTQPDRPVGRKKELKPSEVKLLASKYNIDILQPEKLSDIRIYSTIKEVEPDFIIVAAFGQLLPKNILDIAPCINLHASLLPKYRGASPVQQALLNSDKFTGVTAMLMEEGLDSGPILGYRYFRIPSTMVLLELMNRLSSDASLLTIEILNNFENIRPIEQIRAISTHCKKIKKSDGEVNFDNAFILYNKYRAFYGWPGIFLENGTKLFDISLIETNSINMAGEILDIEEDGLIIGCKRGSLKIKELQVVSKRRVNARAYVIGRGLKVGNSLV